MTLTVTILNVVLGINSNEQVLHILQNSTTGASPSDTVSCYTEENDWGGGVLPTPCRDAGERADVSEGRITPSENRVDQSH